MAHAVLEKKAPATMAPKSSAFSPQAIKISSKRQITIPSKLYQDKGFTDYAWIEETEDGFLIRPIEVEDEDVAIYVLERLVESGFSGDELIERYKKAYPEVLDFHRRVQQAHQDYLDGKGENAHVVQARLREKYGL